MTDISLATVLSTFGLIFLAELPDKTALAALVLATQYRMRDVIIGAWLAFLVQTIVAVAAGSLFALLPPRFVHVLAGGSFLVFAVLAFRRNEEADVEEEVAEVAVERSRRVAPWLASFLVVFAAEWGDLTQLATASRVAQTGDALSVAIGSVLALWSVTVLAAGAGGRLATRIKPALLSKLSGLLFAVMGVLAIASAFF